MLERAFALAERITANGALAVRKIEESVVRTSSLTLGEGYAIEDSVAHEVMRSEEAREGPRAFIEKRAPRLTGR